MNSLRKVKLQPYTRAINKPCNQKWWREKFFFVCRLFLLDWCFYCSSTDDENTNARDGALVKCLAVQSRHQNDHPFVHRPLTRRRGLLASLPKSLSSEWPTDSSIDSRVSLLWVYHFLSFLIHLKVRIKIWATLSSLTYLQQYCIVHLDTASF